MLDERRLDTLGAVNAGVLGMPPPEDIAPENIEWEDISCDDISPEEECKKILKSGKGLDGSGYYGLPRAWPEIDGKYAVDCLQYRQRTVEEHGLSLEEAVERFCDLCGECYG